MHLSLPGETLIRTFAFAVGVFTEAVAVVIIAVAVLLATLRTLRFAVTRQEPHPWADVRLDLGRWLALALEFLLAADVIRTAVAPSWEDIGKLAAIAVIRTGLNYFLRQDIGDVEREQGERPDRRDGG